MAHKQVDISLVVKERRQETPNHQSLVFTRPPHFDYEPGDWVDLGFPDALSGGKTYSFSSSPTEPDLVITFKEGQSQIKRTLQTTTVGDRYRITAYGNDYDFALRERRSSVLIAAGVGVAPFRSMIRDMVDRASTDTLHLTYFNRTPDFLFRDELDQWIKHMPGATAGYVVTEGMKSKERRRILGSTVNRTVHYYYIAGPPTMIETTEAVLMDAGVQHDDIRVDSFDGY